MNDFANKETSPSTVEFWSSQDAVSLPSWVRLREFGWGHCYSRGKVLLEVITTMWVSGAGKAINYLGIRIFTPTCIRKEPGLLVGILAQPVEDYRSTIKSRFKETVVSCILFLTVDLEPIIHSEVSQKEKQQKRHRCKEQNFGLRARRWGWDDLRE